MQSSMNRVQRSLEVQPVKDIQVVACEATKTVLSDNVLFPPIASNAALT